MRKRRQDRFGRGKTILALVKSAGRCPRARHVATVNVGTWETLEELLRMTKHETKNEKFKVSGMLHKGVRLPQSSGETPVTGVERRGQQSSHHILNSHPINIGGTGGQRLRKGQPFLGRWMRINLRAQRHPTSGFNNLLLHINEETLCEAYDELDGTKASGVDGITKSEYGKRLKENLEDLAMRIKRGTYRPQPKREVLIPKANGKTRPIAIACFEDKLVDVVVAKILTNIFDGSFIKNSFGLRPRKSAHQAIETCYKALGDGKRPYVVEIDFSNFFNTIPHEELMGIVRKKVADEKLLRLIERFLKGKTVKQDGRIESCLCGTPQGGLMSPILANIYLDIVLDKWFRKEHRKGTMVRYVDDAVFFFRTEEEAKSFLPDFKARVEKFKLIVNEEKSRSLSFKKTEHTQFNFLGFTFYWSVQNKRNFLKVKTEKKKLHKAMNEFYNWIKQHRSKGKRNELWKTARSKIRGHYEYFGYWMNRQKLVHFYREAVKAMFKWLNRRSQKQSYTWEGFNELVKQNPLGKPPESSDMKRLGWRFGYVQT